jgi:hypothetical protein
MQCCPMECGWDMTARWLRFSKGRQGNRMFVRRVFFPLLR